VGGTPALQDISRTPEVLGLRHLYPEMKTFAIV